MARSAGNLWVAASYLATGIFIVLLIAGTERSGQGALTIVLLSAIALSFEWV